MSAETLDPALLAQHVAAAKAAWRRHAQSLTWEEKIAAIERMWERDAALRAAREQNLAVNTRIKISRSVDVGGATE